ncbi:hypothetical protein D3C74_333060 [compost metagenome]
MTGQGSLCPCGVQPVSPLVTKCKSFSNACCEMLRGEVCIGNGREHASGYKLLCGRISDAKLAAPLCKD